MKLKPPTAARVRRLAKNERNNAGTGNDKKPLNCPTTRRLQICPQTLDHALGGQQVEDILKAPMTSAKYSKPTNTLNAKLDP